MVSMVLALTELRRVLVADDDAAARRLLCTLLDLQEYGLLEAQDGPAALDVARSQRPDVAILDLETSELGGVAVCRALRADTELASIKVVILSEQGRLADRVAACSTSSSGSPGGRCQHGSSDSIPEPARSRPAPAPGVRA
jgi:CheY-like chemotaxis protein